MKYWKRYYKKKYKVNSKHEAIWRLNHRCAILLWTNGHKERLKMWCKAAGLVNNRKKGKNKCF